MAGQSEWIITSEQLQPLLGNVTLLDVRQPEEYAASHIEGCKLIPLGEILNKAERELKPHEDIVIYCAHGVRSMHALAALQTLGFKKLRSLEGGICAWDEFQKARGAG